MTLNYEKTWETMNSLEMTICKVCSAREIIDSAIEALENRNLEKAESLMNASHEFLEYFLNDFDEKFKSAWNETVVKFKDKEFGNQVISNSCMDDSISLGNTSLNNDWESYYYPEEYSNTNPLSVNYDDLITTNDCMYPWGHSDMEYLSQQKEDKVMKWRLPIEMDGPSGEYYLTFPDDLLEVAGIKEGDDLEWVSNLDGSYTLKKIGKEKE